MREPFEPTTSNVSIGDSMLEFVASLFEGFFEIAMTAIFRGTGRGIVSVVSLGQIRCEDDAALWVGIAVWAIVIVAVAVFFYYK